MSPSRLERHQLILELIAAREVQSQEELRHLLSNRGMEVTQSTLSRDLRDLRIARVPSPTGYRYVASEAAPEEPSRAALAAILPQLFVRVDGVDHLVVLKTVPGGGQTVAHALDREPATDIIGTIAGDDTILMICRSEQARERVVRRLAQLARGG